MTNAPPVEPNSEQPAIAPGMRLGKYEIVRVLGSGGMGAVYEANHAAIGKRVAIKTLNPALAATPGAKARFLREAELTTRVQHPHIVDVTDMGQEGDHVYIVMELLRGEDLAGRVARQGPLPVNELVDIVLPVISAVSAAHEAGVIHRDLKPQNIFLDTIPGGIHPKVLDFGISKHSDAAATANLTGTAALMGTPYYLAPEQVEHNKSASPLTDQYALGVILYECLASVRPYEGDTVFSILTAIVAGQPRPLDQLRPDLPRPVVDAVMRAMARVPEARFSSVRSLGAALLPHASARARLQWEAVLNADQPAHEPAAPVGAPNPARSSESIDSGRTRILPPGHEHAVAHKHSGSTVDLRAARPQRGKMFLALAVAVSVSVAGAVFLVTRDIVATPRSSTPLAREPLAVTARPARVRLAVRAEPQDTRLELDGIEVGLGAVTRDIDIDGRSHLLRASRSGYVTRELVFSDRPPPERLVLEKLAVAAAEDQTVESEPVEPRRRNRGGRAEGKAAKPARPPAPGAGLTPNGAPILLD